MTIKNYSSFITLFLCVASISLSSYQANGALYTDWINEYDGTDPNTLALFNFNSGAEFLNSATTGSTGSNTLYYREGNSQTTPSSSQIGAQFGKFGSGLDVTPIDFGSSPSGVYADGSVPLFPSGPDPSLTVEGWFRFDNLDSEFGYLIDKWRFDNNGYLLRRWETNEIRFSVGNGINSVEAGVGVDLFGGANPLIPLNEWVHIAGTWNATEDAVSLYVNGQLIDYATFPNLQITNNVNAFTNIGDRATSLYGGHDGQIDGVRISNIAYDFGRFPGDFDGNGVVDGDDLAKWQNDYGPNRGSDADYDNDSDGRDFLIWQRNAGQPILAPLTSQLTSVPEPSSISLVLLSLMFAMRLRK
jgi:hypothetical protein